MDGTMHSLSLHFSQELRACGCEVLTPSLVAPPPFTTPSPHQDTPDAKLGEPLPL